MPGQIEYMHHAFLFGLALECLADGNRLGERRGAAVHVLDGFPKLVNVIGHADHHSHHGERRRVRWSIRWVARSAMRWLTKAKSGAAYQIKTRPEREARCRL